MTTLSLHERLGMESGSETKHLERIDLPITGMSCASCAAKD